MKIQSDNLIKQNQLIESSRRSNLVFELSTILNQISMETSKQDKDLSYNLIGRIIAFSKSLRPYKYLNEQGDLVERLLSPERTQLLISIIHSNLSQHTLDRIFKDADFSYSDLRMINFEGSYLKGINLTNSYIEDCSFENANLSEADFRGVYFNNSQDQFMMNYESDTANMITMSTIIGEHTMLIENIDMLNVELKNRQIFIKNGHTNFKGANLTNVKLEGSRVPESSQWIQNSRGKDSTSKNDLENVFRSYQYHNINIDGIDQSNFDKIIEKKMQ